MPLFGVFLVHTFPHLDEYGDLRSIFPYLAWLRENTHQKNSEYGHFLRSSTFTIKQYNAAPYSERSQTSKIEHYAVNYYNLKCLTGSECICNILKQIPLDHLTSRIWETELEAWST